MKYLVAELQEDDRLADYQILELIGKGPLATTYRAMNQLDGKEVALKVFKISPSFSLEWLEKLQIETSLLTRLNSPFIDKPLTSGMSGDFFYIVKDFVHDGQGNACHLRHYLEHHGQKLHHFHVYHLLLQLVKGLADALSYQDGSHQGLIHGNLKPENVLVAYNVDRFGQPVAFEVKISDFQPYGLATPFALVESVKSWQDAIAQRPQLMIESSTKELYRAIYSAANYLAPERMAQSAQVRATAQSDVFAVGVIAYELLTGRLPVGRFALPSSLAVQIPAAWDHFIQRCLKADPRARFTSAFELKEHLEKELASEEGLALDLDSVAGAIKKPLEGPIRKERSSLTPKGMVYLPRALFFVGSEECGDDAAPQHACTTDGFYIDRCPVTVAQFEEFVAMTHYQTTAEKEGVGPVWSNGEWRLLHGVYWKNPLNRPLPAHFERHPVTQVSYEDCLAYCEWAGKRLPTEEEWEYAAKGGQKNCRYPFGATISHAQANFASDQTTPVMTYQANGFGLFDIAGNVWEWTSSLYQAYPGSTKQNPHFGTSYHVVRGGCWLYDSTYCMVSLRNATDPQHCYPTVGFRCVQSCQTESN